MSRIRWIDTAKGIGILLVTVGHSRFGNDGWPAVWINSFHMPLFFVMAGLCFDPTRYPSYWAYLRRKGVALAYPYFMLTLFVAILMTGFCVGGSSNYFHEYFIAHPFPGWTIGGFWFIRVLIAVELIYAFFCILFRNNAILMGMWVGLMALGAFWHPDGYCFRLNTIMVSLAFYGLGHALQSVLKSMPSRTVLFYGTVGCFAAHVLFLGLCFNFIVGYGGCVLGNPLKYYPIALLGIAEVSCFSMLLDKIKLFDCVSRALAWLGKYSILLLAIHGACGSCRHSWVAKWSILAGWPSQLMEIALIALLMWLLSGPLNFFMRMPNVKLRRRR